MLHLKHRPRDWTGYVESSPDVGKFRKTLESGRFNGGAILIQGPSSSGKTTLAEIIVHALADDHTEINGANCTVDKVREIARGFAFKPMFGNEWRAIVVNECQSMTDKAVECWLDVLDHLPPKWVIVFTTTEDCRKLFAEFGEAFTSRCKRIVLQRPAEADAVGRLRAIADAEKIEATDWQLAELLKREGRNLRACIQKLEDADLPEPPKPIEPPKPDPAPEPQTPVVQTAPAPTVETPKDPELARQKRMAEDIARATAPVESRHIEVKPVEPPMTVNQLVAFLKTQGIKCKPSEAALALSACNGSIEQLEKMLNVPIRQLNEEGVALESAKSDNPKPKAAAEPKPKESKFGKKVAPQPGPTTYTITRAHEAIAWVALVLIAWPCAQFAFWSVGSIFSASWALANQLVGK